VTTSINLRILLKGETVPAGKVSQYIEFKVNYPYVFSIIRILSNGYRNADSYEEVFLVGYNAV
jgi:hypothetical protein